MFTEWTHNQASDRRCTLLSFAVEELTGLRLNFAEYCTLVEIDKLTGMRVIYCFRE